MSIRHNILSFFFDESQNSKELYKSFLHAIWGKVRKKIIFMTDIKAEVLSLVCQEIYSAHIDLFHIFFIIMGLFFKIYPQYPISQSMGIWQFLLNLYYNWTILTYVEFGLYRSLYYTYTIIVIHSKCVSVFTLPVLYYYYNISTVELHFSY